MLVFINIFCRKISNYLLVGQQKEIQYVGWHEDTTRNVLWSGEDDEVSWGDRVVWGNIEMTGGWQE